MKKLILGLLAMALSACGGGGGSGSSSTGGVYFTHDQLAQEFVRRVNTDVYGYNLTLLKADTEQYNYIVVQDNVYNSYDAYYIGNYVVGQDVSNYLYDNQGSFYYNLDYYSGTNEYQDPITGTIFERVEETTKNLETIQAVTQIAAIQIAAKTLQDNYSMSESKSLEAAKISYHLRNAAEGSITSAQLDQYSKTLTGSTITEFQNALKAGDKKAINSKIELAGQVSGMGPENIQKFIKDNFMK